MPAHQENIQEMSFSNVIGDRFGRYSKYIIQDRALPDIRDGLKPVQRRILYAMYRDRNTQDHPYRKSAKTVGNVIGNYHPHGNTSVYDAMVRMSQSWKNREPLIDMHGNNGSMDGDPAAAMRYTEARLTAIAAELLEDIDAETVDHALNFDDSLEEPVVLPAKFPNLLVNGATGISAGYATDIPPHNLSEVIDALIYLLQHPTCKLADLLKFIKGPDFPTGAIIMGAKDLAEVYRTGRGKVVMRAKTEIEPLRGNKSQIVATELPYEVNKLKLIQRIDEIRLQGKIEGIAEVRDESDRKGLRIVVELKRDADSDGILNYLLKNTDLQMNYNFNMVAIHENRPIQASLPILLQAYLGHRQEVIRRRTQYQQKVDSKRLHIVDGLIRLVSILDEVIQVIRASQNKQDAKENLQNNFDFTAQQAEAIVNLQLYRLTNTDIVDLQNERLELNERLMMYQQILSHEKVLNKVLIDELKDIKKRYGSPRLTQVEEEVEEISVDTSLLVTEESVVVTVTKNGYYKRTSLRSYQSSDIDSIGVADLDQLIFAQVLSTYDALVMITTQGNYIHIPVYELPEIKWKDIGVHLSQHYILAENENILAAFVGVGGIEDSEKETTQPIEDELLLTSQQGMTKRIKLSDLTTYRSYKSRTSQAMVLNSGDQLVSADRVKAEGDQEVLILTHRSYAIRYPLAEVSLYGPKAKGVKAINLKQDDYIIASTVINPSNQQTSVMIFTQKGHIKQFKPEIIPLTKRGGRGLLLLKELKRDPHRVLYASPLYQPIDQVRVLGDTGQDVYLSQADVPLSERLSNGSSLTELAQLGQVIAFTTDPLIALKQSENIS
ncbi:DNA topoisomerase IV subunit A [Ignavigranum ruoffiae]|uniref:DNA topoisomerase IV subunit A n=1 Tax=Ignavigranum ruoffiae TaxID=89093 RepID=UPI0024AD1076|nr:DNA topoisomerase IV subunit A [Ignavigranum ruoffiae]